MALTPEQIRTEQQKFLSRIQGRHVHGRNGPPRPYEMNKMELEYANHLFARQLDGEIAWFDWHVVKFRLANRCWYTPDFLVMIEPDGELQIHEAKGHLEDDAAVKLRLMPRLYSLFRIFIVRRRKGGGWDLEERFP